MPTKKVTIQSRVIAYIRTFEHNRLRRSRRHDTWQNRLNVKRFHDWKRFSCHSQIGKFLMQIA